jgi:hypothetical protein
MMSPPAIRKPMHHPTPLAVPSSPVHLYQVEFPAGVVAWYAASWRDFRFVSLELLAHLGSDRKRH